MRVDHIPHLEIPARMAAEFAAGAGHDIIYNGSSILTRLYYKNLLDLTDIADAGRRRAMAIRSGLHRQVYCAPPTARAQVPGALVP